MTGFAVLIRIGMFLVGELNPLVCILCVKPGIVDGDHILLTEDALQDEQGSEEYNRGDNGNEFFAHETLTSFPLIPFFTKLMQIIPKTTPLSREKWTWSFNLLLAKIGGL